jgi:NADPH:quinone reductase-like Zn-dependent oxidoreductase
MCSEDDRFDNAAVRNGPAPRAVRLGELIELTGAPEHVITIADFAGAQRYGVRFSRGDSGRATYALAEIGGLIEAGLFSRPVGQTFPLADVATAHRVGETGHVRGKLVLVLD